MVAGTPILRQGQWETVVLGLVWIVDGLILALCGGADLPFNPPITGFLTVSTICLIAAWNAEPENLYNTREALYVGVYVGTGVAGAIILFFVKKFASIVIVAFMGFVIALEICCLDSGGLVKSVLGKGLFFSIAVALPVVLSIFIDRMVHIATTAFGGIFISVLGIDLFTGWGLLHACSAFLSLDPVGPELAGAYTFSGEQKVAVASAAAVGLLAMVFQWAVIKYYKPKNVEKKENHA